MAGLRLKVFVTGPLSNNCYLVFDEQSKKGFLIDCPAPVGPMQEFIAGNQLTILFIALTHAHFDHIAGLADVRYPFYLHSEDHSFLTNPELNGSVFFEPRLIVSGQPRQYSETDALSFEGHGIEVIHTPGHTPGSVSLKLGKWLFSGDTLFCHSVGRTDIPKASEAQLLASIHQKLLSLPAETEVYPGHGPATTIGQEKEGNPFL